MKNDQNFRDWICKAIASRQRSTLSKGCYPWDISGAVLMNGVGMTSLPTRMREMRSEGLLTSEAGDKGTKFSLTREGAARARRATYRAERLAKTVEKHGARVKLNVATRPTICTVW